MTGIAALSDPPLLQVRGLSRHYVATRNLLGRPTQTLRAVDDV